MDEYPQIAIFLANSFRWVSKRRDAFTPLMLTMRPSSKRTSLISQVLAKSRCLVAFSESFALFFFFDSGVGGFVEEFVEEFVGIGDGGSLVLVDVSSMMVKVVWV